MSRPPLYIDSTFASIIGENTKIFQVLQRNRILGVKLGGASELNYEEKLNKIRESLYKKLQDIRNQFTQIEKIKVETIKRTDELKNSAEHELNKIEETIAKSKDLVSESKERLHSEISTLKSEVEEKYNEMRKRIIEAMTPA